MESGKEGTRAVTVRVDEGRMLEPSTECNTCEKGDKEKLKATELAVCRLCAVWDRRGQMGRGAVFSFH